MAAPIGEARPGAVAGAVAASSDWSPGCKFNPETDVESQGRWRRGGPRLPVSVGGVRSKHGLGACHATARASPGAGGEHGRALASHGGAL